MNTIKLSVIDELNSELGADPNCEGVKEARYIKNMIDFYRSDDKLSNIEEKYIGLGCYRIIITTNEDIIKKYHREDDLKYEVK